MKTSILIVTALLTSVTSLLAGNPLLKATVTGTVQTQIVLGPTSARTHTAVLNNKRIFDEFQVSKNDYELVYDLNNSVTLTLVGKSASANLPTIPVMAFGNDSQSIIDTKTQDIRIVTNLDAGTATNLFKSLSGEAIGAAHFVGSLNSPVFNKFVVSVIGHGTDATGVNGAAFLKFKVTAKGTFSQAP